MGKVLVSSKTKSSSLERLKVTRSLRKTDVELGLGTRQLEILGEERHAFTSVLKFLFLLKNELDIPRW